MQIKSKVWLEESGELVFGAGKATILEAIAKTGSINKAAKEMNMSYRHAWSYIRSAENRIGAPLLIIAKGGIGGGGARLTGYAKDLLKKFGELDGEVRIFTNRRYKEIFEK